jgi:hypothetical protein
VTITVTHVSDTATTAIEPKVIAQNQAIPEMPLMTTAQNRIILPQVEMRGKKVACSGVRSAGKNAVFQNNDQSERF